MTLIDTLADHIERYLKQLLDRAGRNGVEVRRIELAEQFECVPSQINYVLKTRFSNERGYIVESRRGGGGYIRIIRLEPQPHREIFPWIYRTVGKSIGMDEAEALLERLVDQGYVTRKEAAIIRGSLRKETGYLDEPWDGMLRASLLKSMLLLVLHGS